MKRLILLILFIILCLPFHASALGPMMLLSGGGCIPETYESYWNGDDYPADRDTAKSEGGCATLDGTLTDAATIINSPDVLDGYYLNLDGSNDSLSLPITAQDIFDSAQGSISADVYLVNDGTDSDAQIFESCGQLTGSPDTTNRITLFIQSADRMIKLEHKSNDAAWNKTSTNAIPEDTRTTIKAAWDVAGNLHGQGATIKLGVKVGANAWEYGTATTAQAFTNDPPVDIKWGETNGYNGNDVLYIDNANSWVTTDES